jgi:hypothetical protein
MAIHFEEASNGRDVWAVDDEERTCTCPDFRFRARKNGEECKHLSKYPKPEPVEERVLSGDGFTVSTGGNATFNTAQRPALEEGRNVTVYVETDGDEQEYSVLVRNNPQALERFIADVVKLAGKSVPISIYLSNETTTIY